MTQTLSNIKLKPGSDEEVFAKKALFKRHPIMPEWPKGKKKKYLQGDLSACAKPPVDIDLKVAF